MFKQTALVGRVVSIALGAALVTACTANGDGAVTTANSVQSTSVDVTSSTTTVEPTASWPKGTVTCAELEGNVPVGVDDTSNPMPGLLEIRWGNGMYASIQYADDASCTEASDAWQFLIRPNLNVLFGGAYPQQCELFLALRDAVDAPSNLSTVLVAADELCT